MNWLPRAAPTMRNVSPRSIRIAGRELGVGEGGSKKQSEQAAARAALSAIEQERSEQ